MARPKKLDDAAIEDWLARHPTWTREDGSIARTVRLSDFSAAFALAMRIGMLAEKRDHHPELRIEWGRLRVLWTTHDAGGITALDLELAGATDRLILASSEEGRTDGPDTRGAKGTIGT